MTFGIQILPKTSIHAVVVRVNVAVYSSMTALSSQVTVPARRHSPSTILEEATV